MKYFLDRSFEFSASPLSWWWMRRKYLLLTLYSFLFSSTSWNPLYWSFLVVLQLYLHLDLSLGDLHLHLDFTIGDLHLHLGFALGIFICTFNLFERFFGAFNLYFKSCPLRFYCKPFFRFQWNPVYSQKMLM